jgi:hypothetical protein
MIGPLAGSGAAFDVIQVVVEASTGSLQFKSGGFADAVSFH